MTVLLEQNYTQRVLAPTLIQPDPHQPRVFNNETDFADLLASIAEQGILQPIQVEELADGQYRIIAGSRRLAAAKQLGLPAVPCLVITTPLSDYARLLSQLAENRVRADTDPYDEAIALKTAKALADIEAATSLLNRLDGVTLPANPPAQTETNYERLERFTAYLEQLTTLMTSVDIAQRLPKEIVYLDKASGEYRLTSQALAGWGQLEQACGLSKSKRVSLVRLAQVRPEVLMLVREQGGKSLTPWAILTALAGISPTYQQVVVESLLAKGQELLPALLELLAETLEQLELESATEQIDFPGLVALLLSTPDQSASDLRQRYLADLELIVDLDEINYMEEILDFPDTPVTPDSVPIMEASVEDELDALLLAFGDASPEFQADGDIAELILSDEEEAAQPYAATRPNLSTDDFAERSGDYGSKQGKGRGGSGQYDRGEGYGGGDDGGYGGGGGGGFQGENSTLEGLEAELPPELAAELEALGLSDTAQRSIASLAPADRQGVVEMLRENPETLGKLRSIVKLMREEGYSLEAARRECETLKEEANPDELALSGVQKLVEATNLMQDALETLKECAPDGELSRLAEPFSIRLQDSLLTIRQLLLEAGFEF